VTTVITIIFWGVLLVLILAVVASVVLRGGRGHPAATADGGGEILLSELIAGRRSHGSKGMMGRRGVRTPARVGMTAARHHHRRACTDAPPSTRVIAAAPSTLVDRGMPRMRHGHGTSVAVERPGGGHDVVLVAKLVSLALVSMVPLRNGEGRGGGGCGCDGRRSPPPSSFPLADGGIPHRRSHGVSRGRSLLHVRDPRHVSLPLALHLPLPWSANVRAAPIEGVVGIVRYLIIRGHDHAR
jgi:uncharacterized Zn-binding protein involved in type VI secretion